MKLTQIKRAAEKGLRESFRPYPVKEILVEPDVGSDGSEVVRITVVIDESSFERFTGDELLAALVSVKSEVHDEGEERQTVVRYVSAGDFVDRDGDPES